MTTRWQEATNVPSEQDLGHVLVMVSVQLCRAGACVDKPLCNGLAQHAVLVQYNGRTLLVLSPGVFQDDLLDLRELLAVLRKVLLDDRQVLRAVQHLVDHIAKRGLEVTLGDSISAHELLASQLYLLLEVSNLSGNFDIASVL